MELIHRELKSDQGLGAHQGSMEAERIEQSCDMAVLAYLLLIRACHAAACVSLTRDPQSSGAQCEDEADKSPQSGLVARFGPMRWRF